MPFYDASSSPGMLGGGRQRQPRCASLGAPRGLQASCWPAAGQLAQVRWPPGEACAWHKHGRRPFSWSPATNSLTAPVRALMKHPQARRPSVVARNPLFLDRVGVRVAVLPRAHVADALVDVVLEGAPATRRVAQVGPMTFSTCACHRALRRSHAAAFPAWCRRFLDLYRRAKT